MRSSSDWKVDFSARRVVIVAEAENARAVILARHDSAEAARAELDELEAYTDGRVSGARKAAMRRWFDAEFPAPRSDPRARAFYEELDLRRGAIFSEQRRAFTAIFAKHDSYEAARLEVLAMLEYNRGRLDAARDELAIQYGMNVTPSARAPEALRP